MIIGIGVDIAETARVQLLVEKYGERFTRRILTDYERAEFERRKKSPSYLATRFAAKEAVAKALGTGIGKRLSFQSMQIENDPVGKPVLRFLDAAAETITGVKIKNALVSLSDENHYVVAMVVLES